MDNLLIIFILAVVLAVGVNATLKHFRHESSCCGGGTYKAKPRKLSSVVEKKVFLVEGMTCQHCINRVMEAVHSVEHTSAVVNLKKAEVTVSMEQPVDASLIIAAIEKAGYPVKGTK